MWFSIFFFFFISTLPLLSLSTVPPSETFSYINEGEFGDYISEYDATYRTSIRIFRSPFQLMFYNTPNAYTLALRMGTVRASSEFYWVWEANRGNPVRENATFSLLTNGNLVLADPDGRVAWHSDTADKGVVGFELLPNDASQHKQWKDAMDAELEALESNMTWELTELPQDEIYMLPPQGYTKAKRGQVCKLVKSLYGLKQASREWNNELYKALTSYGFHQSGHDHCLFTLGSSSSFIALLVYVDDILLNGPNLARIEALKGYLHPKFTIKDLGPARYFLGMELARGEQGTYLTQRKYTLDILDRAGLLGCKSVSTPFPIGLNLHADSSNLLADPEKYRRLVGQLLYLNLTRPDIGYATQQLSQHISAPAEHHWDAAMHVLSALVSWKCKKQSTVSVSTAEAEYRAMGSVVRELQWISYLLSDLQISVHTPIPLHCDNNAAIHITKNQVFHERTKHLDMDFHVVRDQFKAGFILPTPISTSFQLADVLTKILPGPRFRFLLSKMCLSDLHRVHLEGGVRILNHFLWIFPEATRSVKKQRRRRSRLQRAVSVVGGLKTVITVF